MANNFTTVAPASTAPLSTKVATLELDDTFQAGVSAIVDASGARAKTLTISAAGAAKVDGSAVTQPVSGTVTVANPTTNPETGLAKDGTDITTPTAMPAGGVGIRGWLSAIWTKLNGTLAVSGTFWQATQPVSGTFFQATQPVSGTVTANAGTGTMAVSIATAPVLVAGSAVVGKVGIDQTTPGTTNLVALAANQTVNVAQINGVTPLMGAGNTGTGSPRVTIATDQVAFSVNAALAASELHIGEVAGKTVTVGVEITRPADTTAYAALDSVNTSTTVPTSITFAGASRVASGTGYITKARLVTDQSTCVAQMRLWLFNAAPNTLNNDNAAFLIKYADKLTCIGYIDFPALTTEAGSDSAQSLAPDIRIAYAADASSQLLGVFQTRTAFTPASGQKFYTVLVVEQN